jgi:hypothetical protein
MKKTVLATILLLAFAPSALAVATTAEVTTFSDVPQTNDNYVAISYLSGEGIVKGYSDGTFKPDQLVNRAEALKIILEGTKAEIPATITETGFTDVNVADWFSEYVVAGKTLGIIGGNPDGTYAPGRDVARSEFVKILLNANGFKPEKWQGKQIYNDVPIDSWFTPYMNYAGQAGLLTADANSNLNPSKQLTRAEVAEIYYLMTVIRNGSDSQFLLNQAETQMAQIEIFIASQDPVSAKRASELSVDMTQQAYKNMPDNNIVLGAAKLARAYEYLVNSYISALQKQPQVAKDWANQAIAKATEAWEANNELQTICRHVKDRANEILTQVATV